MVEVAICAAVRTPIGRLGGGLSSIRPDDLAGLVIAEAVRRAGIDPTHIEEVLLGCANQAGEDNRNVARMGLLLAGLPQSIPGVTVNRLCASGLTAVNLGAQMIAAGEASVVVAGGVESMSRAPWVMPKAETPFPTGNLTVYDSSLGWRFPNPRLAALFPLEAMGETAENVAEQYGISRADQDAFALASHRKALIAQEKGAFDAEILAVAVPQKKGDPKPLLRDEGPRADSSLEALSALKPVFRKGGSVTAGNASTLNDGASALVLARLDHAQAEGWPVLAIYRGSAAAGVDPRFMGIGPVPAARKVLARLGRSVGDLDAVELNEAFAAQALAVVRELGLDEARVNLHGGAIALGHPLGCSGARILTTLIHALRARGGGSGLASLCVGVGQGVATVVDVLAP